MEEGRGEGTQPIQVEKVPSMAVGVMESVCAGGGMGVIS